MNLKIENWKLLVLSIFYLLMAFLSLQVTSDQLHSFFFVAGLVICVFGILSICAYFFKKDYLKPNEFSFSFGVMYLLVGVLVACKPSLIVDNYPMVISAVVVWDSALRMQYAMNLLRLQKGNWIVMLVLALATMICGMVLILVPMEEAVRLSVFRIMLVVDAIANFYTIFSYKSITKHYDLESGQILDIAAREKEEKNEIIPK